VVQKNQKKVEKGEWDLEVVAYYSKLSALAREARRQRATTSTEDAIEVELGIWLEFLHEHLEDGHELKKRNDHLADNSSATRNDINQQLAPRLLFAGKDRRLWFPFKTTVEREIVANVARDVEQKYVDLLGRVVPGTRPHFLVLSFSGSPDAFDQAWRALQREYGDKEVLVRSHLRALSSMPEQFGPWDVRNDGHWDRIGREIRLHMDVLASLAVPFDEYGRTTMHTIQEILPWEVRLRWYGECGPHDADMKTWVENLLKKVEQEADNVRACREYERSRGTYGHQPGGTFRPRVGGPKATAPSGGLGVSLNYRGGANSRPRGR
jgi:Protein of unknown function (DUF1759)